MPRRIPWRRKSGGPGGQKKTKDGEARVGMPSNGNGGINVTRRVNITVERAEGDVCTRISNSLTAMDYDKVKLKRKSSSQAGQGSESKIGVNIAGLIMRSLETCITECGGHGEVFIAYLDNSISKKGIVVYIKMEPVNNTVRAVLSFCRTELGIVYPIDPLEIPSHWPWKDAENGVIVGKRCLGGKRG